MSDLSTPAHAVALTCPDCRTPLDADPAANVAVCPSCSKIIRSVHCGACGRFFATVNRRDSQCPRCLNTLRAGEGQSTFAELAAQRATVEDEVDHDTLATTAPGLFGAPQKRRRGRRLLMAAIVIVVVLVVIAATHKKGHSTPPVTAPCLPVSLHHSISFTNSKDAQGNYQVTATGSVTNNTTGTLNHLFVEWRVMSADLSAGVPTLTPLNGGGNVDKGATVDWHANASTSDGPVPPISVQLMNVVQGGAGTNCG